MIEACIAVGSLLIGYALGYWPNRKNTAYQDMRDLTNQFANLSAQLMNKTFVQFTPPPTEDVTAVTEDEEMTPEQIAEFAALTGGRL